jgi:hypothetical protein
MKKHTKGGDLPKIPTMNKFTLISRIRNVADRCLSRLVRLERYGSFWRGRVALNIGAVRVGLCQDALAFRVGIALGRGEAEILFAFWSLDVCRPMRVHALPNDQAEPDAL